MIVKKLSYEYLSSHIITKDIKKHIKKHIDNNYKLLVILIYFAKYIGVLLKNFSLDIDNTLIST